jgi:hypothetical protein
MRDYAKIAPQFWIGSTGKAPHANMLDIYYLPPIFIAHETGIPFEGASKALLNLSVNLDFAPMMDNQSTFWSMKWLFVRWLSNSNPMITV